MRKWKSRAARIAAVLVPAMLVAFPAAAGSHVSVGIWSGPAYPAYYGERHEWHHHEGYRWPRTAFIYPAPVYVAPAPRVVYVPAPAYGAPITPAATGQCRVWRGDATVDGSGEPFYGRACMFTDGRWHIVP